MGTDPYPTEAELRRIRRWHWDDGFDALMDYVRSLWWMPDWGWHETGRRPAEISKWKHKPGQRYYDISTGGWSGNESLIDAMQANKNLFWAVCWERSRVGGHYLFAVSPQFRKNVRK